MLLRVEKFALIGAVATIFTGCNQPEPKPQPQPQPKVECNSTAFQQCMDDCNSRVVSVPCDEPACKVDCMQLYGSNGGNL
jgi:hypothetical protein